MALELHLVANLKTSCAVVNLNIGLITYDLDDLGHHTGFSAINIAYLVLTHRAINLGNHDVRDNTIYSS